MRPEILEYYATSGRFTDLGGLDLSVAGVADAVEIVQGLVLYDTVAQPFYGVDLSPDQVDAIHERDSAGLLARACLIDRRRIAEPRPPADRIGGRCHTFSRLTVALLRSIGVPARARCGFGTRFNPGWFEDHWVAEYWNDDEHRWVMVDAQLDDTWRRNIGFEGDPLAITAAEFVTAGHAWQAWRRGALDAERCGLSVIDQHGSFWIAGNLRLDLASLNKVEMLPWDVWGAGWQPGDEPTADMLELYDEVAAMTTDPDDRFTDLRRRYEGDDRLRMDGTVFNVERGCLESVE